ncbi:MAG TPA: hypothetical protein VMT28_16560 [Terriglobales bacterium]|nr:hypothetical protein [Terriglobales bacterium]
MKPWLFVFAVSTALLAQDAIPAGTILPIQLNSSLNSKKIQAGRVITATIMQAVPLPASKLPIGTKVIGHVVSVSRATATDGARISFEFDSIAPSRNEAIPVTTDLRALASLMEVEQAQVPISGPDRGTSQNAWTTVQVGGDVVYRGGGPVVNGSQVVAEPAANGVLARALSGPETKCRGEVSDNDRPQALWVFSSEACGAYGFSDLAIVHAGRSEPLGQITLAATRGDLNIRSGSGMLLRVNAR